MSSKRQHGEMLRTERLLKSWIVNQTVIHTKQKTLDLSKHPKTILEPPGLLEAMLKDPAIRNQVY